MHSKKGQISNLHSQQQKLPSLRKINPNDRFPCFVCYDDPGQKITCEECKGNGWIQGSHPMVQFAEDFIEKRLAGMINSDLSNSSGNQSDFGQVMARMSGSYDPQKRPKEVFPISSSKTLAVAQEIRQSRKREVGEECLQMQYFCNECITDQPIKGKRYHCKQCEDFDLCENCFNGGAHAQHQMQEVLPFRRPDNQSLKAQAKLSLLKKTVKLGK